MFLTEAGVLDDVMDSFCICPEGAMFKIWLKSVKFKGIKNTPKDE